MVTPLLNPIRTNGGTLYTFPSATRDLARVFTNSSYSFTFSHFACLNIPDMDKLTLMGSRKHQANNDSNEKKMADQLQSYVMNYETALLNGEGDDDDYDNTVLRSVSERVFFNWLRKIGGINFVNSENDINLYYERCYLGYDGSDSDTEEDYVTFDPDDLSTHTEYVNRRTIKYIGKIDTINTVEINGDTYSELYLHIPSGVGASYEVRFGAVTDNNYDGGYCTIDGDGEKIIGRSGDDAPDAIYDWDSADEEGNSDDYENTYIGDAGFVIDFRDTFYRNDLVGYSDIMSMNDLSPDDFEFNCVLIYYEYTEVSSGDTVTNLYGVLFLDNYTNNYIQRYPKHKTTNVAPGNSFALKVDLKMDAYPTSNMTAYYENDNQELLDYFQLYTDAMTKLQTAIDTFSEQQNEILNLQTRVHELETLFFGIDKFSDLITRIQNVETTLNSTGIADQEELTNLIAEVNSRVTAITSGTTPLELQYNTDVLKEGYGIKMTKSNGNIVLNSSLSNYSMNDVYVAKNDSGTVVYSEDDVINEDNPLEINHTSASAKTMAYTELEQGQNFCVIYVTGDTCTNDVNIYIDDTDVSWKKGQTLKLKIKDYIDFDSFSLYIHTGIVNGTYSQNIKIDGSDIPYTPTIEIICKDETMNQTDSSFIYEVSSTDTLYENGGSSSSNAEAISTSEIDNIINEIL